MPKNVYFLKTSCNIAAASGNPNSTADEGSSFKPPRCYSRLMIYICRVRI